jgi:hypothetical protein
MKRPVFVVPLAALLLATNLLAKSLSDASVDASTYPSQIVGAVIFGGASLVVASGALTITAIEKTADGVVVVLGGASETIKISIKDTGDTSGIPTLATGQRVQVIQEATGTALMVAGKIIAFVPNDLGKSMLHHSQVVGY